jgi:predicted DNA-binding transcriptional regulator AlpA
MQTFLQQARAAQSATRLSGRQLCQRVGLSRRTYYRWLHRQQSGQPLWLRPGPAKTGPLPLARVREQIRQLPAGPQRTRGTGALYEQYRDGLSRRQLAELVRQHRRQQRAERRARLLQITWYTVHTAWALDATEWPTLYPGRKLQVLAARDLASNYGLGLQAQTQLCGQGVAAYLAQLIRRHGPPLFLKRDNGAVLHTPDVEQVLAAAAVLPLDSPAYYPRYNGGMEKHIGDLKRLFPYQLPAHSPEAGPSAQALLEALRHEANAQPRLALDGCSPAEMFQTGPRLHVDRPTRIAIFHSLQAQACRSLAHMKTRDQRSFNAAWRLAAQSWLRCQALISISTHQKPKPKTN